LLWHYTTGEKSVAIVQDGLIKPTACRIDPRERPAVWFSTNQWREPTAGKTLQSGGKLRALSMLETAAYGKGLVRFGVAGETAPVSWRQFRTLSGVSPETYRNLARAGKKHGADPHQWYASFESVGKDKWLAVEVFHDGKWMPVNDAIAAQRAADGKRVEGQAAL
jgi:hypothetical protein